MNIFFLDENPRRAAELHCDKHVVKMIIETAQMLYAAHWVLSPEILPESAYKLAHKNHPCTIWARKTLFNYLWLCSLGWWLCKEYQHRYGLTKIHKTEQHIVWLLNNPPKGIPKCGFTNPAQAMPPEFKQKDTIRAYHTFYRESKLKDRGIVAYTKREWPDFLTCRV
jgi:hypothetical protein